jgi:hypothetical protein
MIENRAATLALGHEGALFLWCHWSLADLMDIWRIRRARDNSVSEKQTHGWPASSLPCYPVSIGKLVAERGLLPFFRYSKYRFITVEGQFRCGWTVAWGKCFICGCYVSLVARRRTSVRRRSQGEQSAAEGIFPPCDRPALKHSIHPS